MKPLLDKVSRQLFAAKLLNNFPILFEIMKLLNPIIITIFSLALLTPPTSSQSNEDSTYQPKTRLPQQRTESSSIRGCRQNLPQIQVLAPQDRVATMGKMQTFLLKISEIPSSPLKVSVNQSYVANTVWLDELIITQSGIITVTIPDEIELKSNLDYIFTASIPCEDHHLAGTKFVRIFFQYADNQSINGDSKAEKVNSMLDNGFFYDALFLSYKYQLPQFEQILAQFHIKLF